MLSSHKVKIAGSHTVNVDRMKKNRSKISPVRVTVNWELFQAVGEFVRRYPRVACLQVITSILNAYYNFCAQQVQQNSLRDAALTLVYSVCFTSCRSLRLLVVRKENRQARSDFLASTCKRVFIARNETSALASDFLAFLKTNYINNIDMSGVIDATVTLGTSSFLIDPCLAIASLLLASLSAENTSMEEGDLERRTVHGVPLLDLFASLPVIFGNGMQHHLSKAVRKTCKLPGLTEGLNEIYREGIALALLRGIIILLSTRHKDANVAVYMKTNFVDYIERLVKVLQDFKDFGRIARGNAHFLRKLQELMQDGSKLHRKVPSVVLSSNVRIEFHGAHLGRKLSFACPEVGVVHLLGSSGSGKSTLLKRLLGRSTDIADVTVSGLPLTANLASALQKASLYLAPSNAIVANTTLRLALQFSVLHLAKSSCLEELLGDELEVLEMRDKLDMPTSRFSSGESQRASLLQACLSWKSGIRIFGLDEILSNCDVRMKDKATALIAGIQCNSLVIMISHDPLDLKRLPGKEIDITACKSNMAISADAQETLACTA